MQIQSVKGMHDLLMPDSVQWQKIRAIASELFENFGFQYLEMPVVERTELFARSSGHTSDIVQKQMYVFQDKKGESFCLRPEGTAPVVRAYIEHRLYYPEAYQKFYYWAPMYRYERMQKGRYRQHTQVGIEVLGAHEPYVDAECIFLLTELYRRLGLAAFSVELNSIGDSTCRPAYREKLVSYFQAKVSALCEDCQSRLKKNPMRTFDCKNEACKEVSKKAPRILDDLCGPCATHFESVKQSLKELKVPFDVNSAIVRGLDYYVRTAFEVKSSIGLGAQDTLGAGGRYDGLVKTLGGPDTAGFGFATGIERLMLSMPSQEVSVGRCHVFVAVLGDKARAFAFTLVNQIRLKHIKAEINYENKSLKVQMKQADRLGAQYVLMIGDHELSEGKSILRNMQTQEQVEVAFSNIISTLEQRIQI
ncbi:MAG: histidine--tRNA ligase [Deltaproteobacteria bacterium]|nr:histidine--tRNA ligase [Deltaproteobacteria bacterium]